MSTGLPEEPFRVSSRDALRAHIGGSALGLVCIVIVAGNIYQAVKQALQDLVAPQIESLKGDIGQLRGEVRGEIAELRREMRGNHAAVSAEIRRLDDKLTWALDLRERIVALETKLAAAPERP